MEYETWVQLANVHALKQVAQNLKSINPLDTLVYMLYLLLFAIGAYSKNQETSKNAFSLLLIVIFSQLAFILLAPEKESNYYIITTMFYVRAIFYFHKVNLKTSIACAIMSAYLFIMSMEARYYEIHGSSFSDVLHDSYWLVILVLHCIICGSFFSRSQYKRAYMGLCKLICSRKVS